ncbi:MAG: hypothetical protein WC802_05155 [Patescibacteria group bacterium]|jgi:hypothetical protein
MHEHAQAHEEFIRQTVKGMGIKEVVYVTENTYDGGYEVRVGTFDFFVDYETLDEEDTEYIREQLKKYA